VTRARTGRERDKVDENAHSHSLCVIRILWGKVVAKTKLLREKLQRGYCNVREASTGGERKGSHSTMIDPRRITSVSGVVTSAKVFQRWSLVIENRA